jgi:uncharacterized membrane protein
LKDAFVLLNRKGITSTIGYFISVPLAFVHPLISAIIFSIISVIWLIPDRNLERALNGESPNHH